MEHFFEAPPGAAIELVSPGTPRGATANVAYGFSFLLNVARLIDAKEFELAPGHVLRGASDSEIIEIKGALERYSTGPSYIRPNWWECRHLENGNLEALPSDQWRYFVVAFEGTNTTMVLLEQIFELIPFEIETGFTILGGRLPGTVWHPELFFQAVEEYRWGNKPLVEISANDVSHVQALLTALQQHDNTVLDLVHIIGQLKQLKALPRQATVRFLGYFAILESLLTHPPKPTDPYDSITRQIKKKLKLLNRRCSLAINYKPFQGATEEAIWGKMYAYRSLLAHGGKPEFAGELALLKDHKTALILLKDAVKAVIRQALVEPQLVADLRDC